MEDKLNKNEKLGNLFAYKLFYLGTLQAISPSWTPPPPNG